MDRAAITRTIGTIMVNFSSLNPVLYDPDSDGRSIFKFFSYEYYKNRILTGKVGLDLVYRKEVVSYMLDNKIGMDIESWICFWFHPGEGYDRLTDSKIISETACKILGFEEQDEKWLTLIDSDFETPEQVATYLRSLIYE